MRLFAAVEIGEGARRVAEATAHALRLGTGPSLDARWVPPENMHLTVRFIGHVDDRIVPDMLAALARPIRLAPFDVELGASGVFPPSGPPRVLWIGLAAGQPGLSALRDEFDRRLAPFGFEPERRTFSAHLTLARLKQPPRSVSTAVRAAVAHVATVPAAFHVSHATIFESRVSSRGPRYEPLGRAPLRDPASS
jgi:2'-5' RNA ligase